MPIARRPSTRIIRLTTLARTGRRMNRSVNLVTAPSLVARLGIGIVGRRHGVVDRQERALPQLDLTGSDDRRALLDPGENGDLVAARCAGGNEDLPRDELGPTLGVFALIVGQEHRGAVGII